MEYRKRPRLSDDQQPPSSQSTSITTSSTSSSSPAIKLLQTELRTLRAELSHSQSIRSIERKNASQSETRLKRQLADAYEEITQCNELIESLRERVDKHSEVMEESRQEWLERIQWYEDQFNNITDEGGGGGGNGRRRRRQREDEYDSYGDDDDDDSSAEEEDEEEEGGLSSVSRNKYNLLQQRLDATLNQVHDLEQALGEANEFRMAAEQRATELRCTPKKKREEVVDENKAPVVEIPRDLRIKVAETERANRELHRQNEALKARCQDMIQHRERVASSQRKVKQLEKDVQLLTQEVEEGKEAQSRWMRFRYDIVGEIGGDENEDGEDIDTTGLSSVPPEISTVIRKFRTLKQTVKRHENEIARITQLSDAHLRRCKVLETQLNEKSQSISLLEKTVNDQEIATNQLELENRKIVAQQNIWKREVEGMRSLLDTYEQQETMQAAKKSSPNKSNKTSGNADGLQLSLNSARDEIKLLSETNDKLESTIEELRTEQQTAKVEHERVLDKFYKLRNAVMDERSKAESAEVRANQAETLAGKGSYNSETTRVLHLKDNPLMDAIKDKYQAEIDSLKRRLEEAENNTASQETTNTTPATSKATRGSFGSAGSRDSASAVDVQKLHSRLKEQFRNQIALFRQGVYLITGFKIDMSPKSSSGDNDVQIFTVRSVYGEREDDHIMFQWSPKKKSKLDMLNTDMAHLLMKGPSGVYVKEHGSWPGFMASVTLQLFDQQTVL